MKKCIIRQDWTTYEADTWRMLDRRSFVYVTNEDGTPHIYDSIKEARAEIAANYGTEPNSRGILYNHTKDDSGNDHWSTVTIVREGTDEYAKATGTEATENAAKTYTIICTTKANRTEYLHAVTVEAANVTEAKKNAAAVIRDTLNRHAFALANEGTKDANHSVNFCARRYGMTAAEVIEAARAPQGIDLYGAASAEIVNEAMQAAEKAAQEAAEAERRTADAAIIYDTEAAAAHAAEARRAAIAAEQAAAKAAAAASMTGASSITCSTADSVSEVAAIARAYADSAAETAQQAAAEANRPSPEDDDPAARIEAGAPYHREDLEAFLGAPEGYDVGRIEAAATAIRTYDGVRVWAVGPDLVWSIAERCELYQYSAV